MKRFLFRAAMQVSFAFILALNGPAQAAPAQCRDLFGRRDLQGLQIHELALLIKQLRSIEHKENSAALAAKLKSDIQASMSFFERTLSREEIKRHLQAELKRLEQRRNEGLKTTLAVDVDKLLDRVEKTAEFDYTFEPVSKSRWRKIRSSNLTAKGWLVTASISDGVIVRHVESGAEQVLRQETSFLSSGFFAVSESTSQVILYKQAHQRHMLELVDLQSDGRIETKSFEISRKPGVVSYKVVGDKTYILHATDSSMRPHLLTFDLAERSITETELPGVFANWRFDGDYLLSEARYEQPVYLVSLRSGKHHVLPAKARDSEPRRILFANEEFALISTHQGILIFKYSQGSAEPFYNGKVDQYLVSQDASTVVFLSAQPNRIEVFDLKQGKPSYGTSAIPLATDGSKVVGALSGDGRKLYIKRGGGEADAKSLEREIAVIDLLNLLEEAVVAFAFEPLAMANQARALPGKSGVVFFNPTPNGGDAIIQFGFNLSATLKTDFRVLPFEPGQGLIMRNNINKGQGAEVWDSKYDLSLSLDNETVSMASWSTDGRLVTVGNRNQVKIYKVERR